MRYILGTSAIGVLMTPLIVNAATLESWLWSVYHFIDIYIIPTIIFIAVFVFMWNAVRFFILEGDSDEGKEKAKSLMIWGILGLVLMLVFLGIVELLVNATGLDGGWPVCPDYNPDCIPTDRRTFSPGV